MDIDDAPVFLQRVGTVESTNGHLRCPVVVLPQAS